MLSATSLPMITPVGPPIVNINKKIKVNNADPTENGKEERKSRRIVYMYITN